MDELRSHAGWAGHRVAAGGGFSAGCQLDAFAPDFAPENALAAALVAFNTFDPAGQRLIDTRLLNVVLVLMLTTAVLGPVLTARFAPPMRVEAGIS